MFTPISKIRRSITILAAAGAMAVAAGAIVPDAKAVSARPTGNAKQDAYCKGVADLINKALAESDWAYYHGNESEGDAWMALAGELARRGNQNGCSFVWRVVKGGQPTTPRGGGMALARQ